MLTHRTKTEWDLYWLGMAKYASRVSKDPSTKCYAIIVRPDNSPPIAQGYNGFPRKLADHPHLLLDRDARLKRTIHAEVNAQIAARADLTGCTLYIFPFQPCDRCAVQMIQAGIIRVVAPEASLSIRERWADSIRDAQEFFVEAGVELVTYPVESIP